MGRMCSVEGPRGGESSRLLFCSESVDYSSSKTRKARNGSTSMLFRNCKLMHEWPNYFFLDWYYLFYISHKRFQNYRLTPVYKAILSLVIRIHPEKIQLMLGYFLQLFHHTDPSGIQIIKILQQKRCHEKVDLLLGYYTLLIILIYYLKYGWFFCLSYSLY